MSRRILRLLLDYGHWNWCDRSFCLGGSWRLVFFICCVSSKSQARNITLNSKLTSGIHFLFLVRNKSMVMEFSLFLLLFQTQKGLSGRFDANGFLMDSPSRRIQFFCQTPNVSESQLMSSLRVRSYKNSRVVSNQGSNAAGRRRYKTMQDLVNHLRK